MAVARSASVSVCIYLSIRWERTSITGADAEDDLANVDAGDLAVRLAEGAAHARLQAIGTGARQHLVDADDVVRVGAHAQVEAFLAGDLDEVLVGADAGRFEGLRRELLVLVWLVSDFASRMDEGLTGDEVDAVGEFVDAGLLSERC